VDPTFAWNIGANRENLNRRAVLQERRNCEKRLEDEHYARESLRRLNPVNGTMWKNFRPSERTFLTKQTRASEPGSTAAVTALCA
jgi:hypothetical protein